MKYNYVVVGAGLSGCIVAEQLSKNKNKQILIIEKRNHIAGNCYDFKDSNNIIVHKYGPHIFHTNIEKVWNYLSQFTDWAEYEHCVLANFDGMNVPVPFNLNSLYQCFPVSLAELLEKKLLDKYQFGAKIPILKLRQENDEQLRDLSDFVYNKVFLGYTTKQWGMKPEELDDSVTARIPIFLSRDNRYFQDKFQGIPKFGYTKLIENIIQQPNIHLMLDTDFFELQGNLEYEQLYFSGMIDEYFDFQLGKLSYRSLKFEFETLELVNNKHFQAVAQVNYPYDYDYTRITEFSHFYKQSDTLSKSVIAREYPIKYEHKKDEIPYYPIPQQQNDALFRKYKDLSKGSDKVIFLGRLADYSYYNMDQTVARALSIIK